MILAGGTIMVIGTIILGSSYSRAQFLVGRVVTGFGNGINSSTVPTYQSGKWKTSTLPNGNDQRLMQTWDLRDGPTRAPW
jgi:MFS family permease